MFLSLLFATAFAGTDITLSTSDGVKVHAVHEEAKGATRGTILVHMAGRSATDWSYVAQRLSKGGHHVVAPDLRGHGKNASDDPDAEIPPEDYPLMIHEVEAAADFLRSHGVTEVSCAGASIGANLCLQAAAKDDAIVNLVLLSPGLNYKGVKTIQAIERYGDRPVLFVASEDDKFAFKSASVLESRASGQRKLELLTKAGHGTKMLNRDPGLEGLVTSWLLGTYELSSGQFVAPKPRTAASAETVETTGEKLQSHQ